MTKKTIDPNALFSSAATLYGQGRYGEALEKTKRVLAMAPDHPQVLNLAAACAKAVGFLAEAEKYWLKAVAIDPRYGEGHNNLGVLYKAQGRNTEAEKSYRLALEINPRDAGAHGNLGNLLKESKRFADAEVAYRQALHLRPGDPITLNNLGTLLHEQQRYDEASEIYLLALALRPDLADACNNLADLLYKQGDQAGALVRVEQCLAMAPEHPKARFNRLMFSLPQILETTEAGHRSLADFDRQLDIWINWASQPRRTAAGITSGVGPFYLAYVPENHRDRLARYGDTMSRIMAAQHKPRQLPPRPARSPIRLAVVSHHVRNHSVWHIVLHGLLANLDRNHFEVILLHTDTGADGETERAKGLVERFYPDCQYVDQALQILQKEQPDAILYPEVGMDPVASTLASLRLAPLQMASWGHPITTGLPTIDLFLSGELLEGDRASEHYRETLVRLPGTGACTLPPATAAEPVDPSALGLPEDRRTVRFVICQMPFKLAPGDDQLYVDIARKVGDCQFWFVRNPMTADLQDRLMARLAAAFQAAGLDPRAYLREIPWLPVGQFYSLLDEMDIYLDCPAFSGYTTAWQAVHRGIPIITLEGEFMRQRLAAGLLRQIGMADTVADSRSRYVEIAGRLSQEVRDPEKRAARRQLIGSAAGQGDGNTAVVNAFAEAVTAALGRLPAG